MTREDTIENFFTGDGTSQDQRAPIALPANYARLDDRSMEEILSSIYKYAAYVFYYAGRDPENPDGDWQDFFSTNLIFRYAAIQQFRRQDLESAYNEARDLYTTRITGGSFWPLFNRIMAVALQLQSWQKQLDTDSPLYRVIQALIKSDFSKAMAKLIAVAGSFTVRENDFANDLDVLRSNEDWNLTLEILLAVDQRLSKLDPYSRRKENETLTELDEIFQVFFKGIHEIQKYARDHFEEVLEGTGNEEPHLGLLFSFLRLYLKVRDGKKGLNDITGRHLDFFYKDILALKHRSYEPDHVHMVIELAKQVNSFLLSKDTVLKDGKDNKGKDISFVLEDETVFNKATVEQLRTLYKDAKGTLYQAMVANSADGLGAGFQDKLNNSWPTLGANNYPFARTGFVLSSGVLLLREGQREIFVSITLENLAKLQSDFADLFSKHFYFINAAAIAGFEKAGVSKDIINLLDKEIKKSAAGEIWLDNDAEFKKFTSINDTALLAKIKSIAFISLLEVFYSAAEGWLPVPDPKFGFDTNSNILTLKLTLQPGDKPLSIPGEELQKISFPMKAPGLKILFNHRLLNSSLVKDDTALYDVLSKATIGKIYINVKAGKIKNILLGNDEGLIDPNKKFFPFTAIPKTGSSFFIGSDELFRKKLTGLSMNVEWDGLPDDFKKQYEGYQPVPPKNIEFTAEVQKLNNSSWESWSSPKLELFTNPGDPTDAAGDRILDSQKEWIVDELNLIEPEATAFVDIPVLDQPELLAPLSVNSVTGFIRLLLNKNFYHQEYPFILANSILSVGKFDFDATRQSITKSVTGIFPQSVQVAKDALDADTLADNLSPAGTATPAEVQSVTDKTRIDASTLATSVGNLNNKITAAGILPKPPYTPAIKSFSIDYTAAAGAADITMLHLYPFEDANFGQLPAPINEPPLFPSFDSEGCLYIGLTNANPGNNIALLFQLSEYSADPDIDAAKLEWHYLKYNDWTPLKKDIDIISDKTQGLLVSGIVTISLPWDANTQHTILPTGYHWLKISASEYTAAVCKSIVVAAQGASAIFRNNENDLARLSEPLPANSITGLLEPHSEIKKISQDYPSFKGRKEETDDQFYIRVSERLRHKGRSISIFDYERLVLEAFPEVFKVKCIPHTKICKVNGQYIPLSSPGWITLAVIPDISGYTAQTRLKPKVSRIVLKEIEDYFLTISSAFAKVQAINLQFQEVDFEGSVKFIPGKDQEYYKQLLKKDVEEYLSPWIKGTSKNIVFGGTLMMSSVLKFIEAQKYVSYVTDFTMKNGDIPVRAVTALKPWNVLTSRNQIYIVIEDKCNNERENILVRDRATVSEL